MRRYLALFFVAFFMFPTHALTQGTSDDFFAKDPEAIYDKNYQDFDLVVEIPGHKLTPALIMPPITEENSEYAKRISPEIIERANKYIEYRKVSTHKYNLYAAKEVDDYILLYFTEPEIIDGFFELIYSKKLGKIIGTFAGVQAG